MNFASFSLMAQQRFLFFFKGALLEACVLLEAFCIERANASCCCRLLAEQRGTENMHEVTSIFGLESLTKTEKDIF